ncbi:sulfite exporter TauE/SafE family protein [Niabella aquatica]
MLGGLTLLFFAGLLAGAMNAVAGGGSFITFPALLYVGVPPVTANASSTVALFPGSMAGAWEYRKYLQPFPGVSIVAMIICTFLGGCTGALLLLYTPSASFSQLVPWLLLTGTLSFAFGKRAGTWLGQRIRIGSTLVLASQFLLGIYGGYFGGAVGIMMMAVWSLFGMSDIKVVNANKNLFVGIANAIAVMIFIFAGKVAWLETGVMLAATIIGAYIGAHYTKGMNAVKLRQGIVIFNFVITAIFFIKVYL